ncbi:MAG TPA: NAD(+) synthase [Victivallales bacterium]|nr:NAD(+) synthase [Victivallales bacterium]
MFGFYRVAVAVPKLKIGDLQHNKTAIFQVAEKADAKDASVIVFPELCMTGYSCADLFQNSKLLEKCAESLDDLAVQSKKIRCVIIVGAPIYCRKGIYNCAVLIKDGKIIGVVPKIFIPNYKEFYEKRWFLSGRELEQENLLICGKSVPFSSNIIFSDRKYLNFAVELCEDLWSPVPPSANHAIAGANLIFNLSASNELIGKADYRRDLVRHHSARCICAYAFCSAGLYESSTDTVFGGHCMVSENGSMLLENPRFESEGFIGFADLDCQKLNHMRLSESSFSDAKENGKYQTISIEKINEIHHIQRSFESKPFVPSDKSKRDERCREIFNIQTSALFRRMEHTKSKKMIIGISGGLDSTLAILVAERTIRKLGANTKDIIAVTMPGFGTGSRTFKNAVSLAKILKVDLRTINISQACKQHLKDIRKSSKVHDVTFENVQARERTQILMDIANNEKGIVVGTGDLSEIALGWSTFNGDHMSMYSVNSGIPKTLVRHIIGWIADNSPSKPRNILLDILDTPISPELLPLKKDGKMTQETEKIIGSYELHDFFLYHVIKYGASPEKLDYIANIAFKGIFGKKEIRDTLRIFISRFFNNQFKRNCCPDGPKVGTISLSPRADWRMPSDISPALWLEGF